MTIASTTNRVSYTGNGATSVYAYTFKIFSADDLLVTVKNTATPPVETTLVKTTDYTVSGVGETSGGNVTLVNSSQAWLDVDGDLLTNYILVIRRVVDLLQSTDIRNQGSFFPETHENEFDLLVMADQQQQDELDRSIKLPESVTSSTFDPTLPTDIATAGGMLVVNDNGDAFEVDTSVGIASKKVSISANDTTKDYLGNKLVAGTNITLTENNNGASETLTIGLTTPTISPVLTTPQINDTSSDHQYVFAVNELAADRTVTLPLLTGNDEFVFKDHTVTMTNKTLTSPVLNTPTVNTPTMTTPKINDTSSNHTYNFAVNELSANRTVTLPLLTGNDEFVFKDHTVTLTNKTIDADSNTITNIENADIKAAAAIAVNKLAATTASRALASDASGFITASATTSTELGYVSGVTSAIQTQLNNKQGLDATLTALAAYNTNGIVTQTAADTFAGRTVTGTSNQITVSNGDGVSGNPTLSISSNPVLPGTEGVVLPTGTTAQRPGSPTAGEIRYNSDTSSFEGYSSAWGSLGGSGGGLKNYIDNPDAEADTTGWATFDDAGAYVNGTGGTASNLTFTRNTSSPLSSNADFDLVVAAADASGEGVSYDFTIDNSDKYSILRISFNYTTDAADDFFYVYIYDVTNSAIIYPVTQGIKATSTTGKFVSEFQATSSTSYRFSIMVKATTATGFTINFDDVSVGPREVARGPVVTDWTSYTPTISGFGTVSNSSAFYRRVGDEIEVRGFFTSGTRAATTALIGLPSGFNLSSSSTKFISAQNRNIVGKAYRVDSTVTFDNTGYGFILFTDASSNLGSVYVAATAASDNTLTASVGTGILGSDTESLIYSFKAPVAGWSSNSVFSSDFGGRVITTRVYLNAATNHTSASGYQKVPFDSTTHDTVAGFVLASNRITIVENGYYMITGSATFSNITDGKIMTSQIYKNGSGLAVGSSSSSGVGTFNSSIVTTTANLTKGDYIELYAYQDDSASEAYITGSDRTWLEVTKIQSPQTLIGGQVVAMTAYLTATDTGVTNKVIVFNNKEFDTHNALNTSTGVWTCPEPGKYNISASVYIANSGTPTNDNMQIRKNGTGKLRRYLANLTASTTLTAGSGSINLDLIKGDTIDIYITGDASFDIQSGADTTFSIMKI